MTNQLSLIPSTTPLLSIQDAAQAFTQKNGTGLVLGGCAKIVTHDDRMQPPPNCTTTCEDLSEVFSSAATFQNCLALPTISNLGRTGALSRDDLALMKTFGLDEGFGAVDVAASVVEPIVDCLVGYVSWCQSDSVCAEGDTKALSDACAPSRLAKSSNSSFLSDDTHSGIANCIDSLCATIVAPVNTDIAGVGVYVSYLMQAGLVLVAFLALKWWDSGLYYTCLVARLARQGYVEAQRRALRTEARHLQHKERLIVALVEFQKAQCFFMLAVQIAALVVLHDGLLAASNLEQIFIDTYALIQLSIGGMLPITLVLLELRRVGQSSWYLSILSLVVVAFSGATYILASRANPSRNLVALVPTSTYPKCGMANPTSNCLNYDPTLPAFANGIGSFGSPLFCSLAVLGVLIAEQCHLHQRWGFKTLWVALSRWFEGLNAAVVSQNTSTVMKSTRQASQKRWFRFFIELATFSIIMWYLTFLAIYLKHLANLASRGRFGLNAGYVLDFSSWTFGQVVSLTIWLPPLCEYVKLELEGLSKGHNYRLPKGWKVVKVHGSGVVSKDHPEGVENGREVNHDRSCVSVDDHDCETNNHLF